MKKLLLFISVIAISFCMTSYQQGYGSRTTTGSTGAPGENGSTCGRSGCHSSGAFSPSLQVYLTDSNGVQVSEYFPEEVYTVSLQINHTGLPGGYGFQMVCLDNDENLPINTFSDFPQDVGDLQINGRQYVEQNRRLPVDSIFMTWTAPAKETGDVTFYVAANANNANGGSSGDGAANGGFTFAEALGSSTSDIIKSEFNVFPNPTFGDINIPETISINKVTVTDMAGRIIQSGQQHNMNISDAPQGAYTVHVIDTDNNIFSKVIEKR